MKVSIARSALAFAAAGLLLAFSASQAKASVVTFEDRTGPSTFVAAGGTQTLTYTFGTLTVTFSGGVILTHETAQSTDNTSVYATADPTTGAGASGSLTNPLTVTFSQPIVNFQIDALNAILGNYRITDNVGDSLNFNLPITGGSVQTEGFAAAGTQVQIFYLGSGTTRSSTWDFAIDNVRFNEPLTVNTPEPASLTAAGLGLGLLGLAGFRRRKA